LQAKTHQTKLVIRVKSFSVRPTI